MKKIKLLRILVGLLVATNLVLVFWLMRPKPPGPGGPGAEARIQRIFGFDEEQMDAFRQSRDELGKSMHQQMQSINDLSIAYYSSSDQHEKDSLLAEVITATESIYALNDNHFDDIRQICREDQIKHLQGLIRSLVLRGKGDPKAPPKKH